jgi:hypothetical protein
MVTTWKITLTNRFGKTQKFTVTYGDAMTQAQCEETVAQVYEAENVKARLVA